MRMIGVVVLVWGASIMAQGTGGEDAVRAARRVSNQMIVERNFEGYVGTITPDFVITTGSGKAYNRAEFLGVWKAQFKSADWHGCVRTAEKVEVSASQPAAAEHGRFECRSKQVDGEQIYVGTYLAMWVKVDGSWKTRSELFVTLGCSGSAACLKPKS